MVIFSTSPLGVFQQSFLIAGGMLIVGTIGLVVALFRRMRRSSSWLGLAISCVVLGVFGVVLLGVTIRDMSTSTQTITARLDQKSVVQQSCSEDGDSCNNAFVLSMTVAPKAYDFTVAKATYAIVTEGQCYQVTYYPGVGLFPANAGSDLYVATSDVIKITQMDQGACSQ